MISLTIRSRVSLRREEAALLLVDTSALLSKARAANCQLSNGCNLDKSGARRANRAAGSLEDMKGGGHRLIFGLRQSLQRIDLERLSAASGSCPGTTIDNSSARPARCCCCGGGAAGAMEGPPRQRPPYPPGSQPNISQGGMDARRR